ncbi:MAG: hypothetical protein LBU34_08660 [Planctomycetaceae bacterium]|jgi:hypothetical protein|nr:hypothetical protein [Planctomycetaceae bacterium]
MNGFHIFVETVEAAEGETSDCPDFRRQRQEEKIRRICRAAVDSRIC